MSPRFRIWLPWVVTGVAVVAALTLLVFAVASHLAALEERREVDHRRTGWQVPRAVQGETGPGPDTVAGPESASGTDATVDSTASPLAALPGQLQRIVDQAGVDLLQFLPEAVPATVSAARAGTSGQGHPEPGHQITVQIRGDLAGTGRFLHALARSLPALELRSLRLNAGEAAAQPVSTLVLQTYDPASLRRFAADVRASSDAEPALGDWADLSVNAFGPPAVAVGKTPVASMTASVARDPHHAPHGTSPSLVDALRLTGLLASRGASAALIRSPDGTTLALREGEDVPGMHLRIVRIGEDSVTLSSAGGGLRRLELGILVTPEVTPEAQAGSPLKAVDSPP